MNNVAVKLSCCVIDRRGLLEAVSSVCSGQSVGDGGQEVDRVTKLGEFSSVGKYFSLGSFFITELYLIWDNLFPR
jgi:hypothetical protein